MHKRESSRRGNGEAALLKYTSEEERGRKFKEDDAGREEEREGEEEMGAERRLARPLANSSTNPFSNLFPLIPTSLIN